MDAIQTFVQAELETFAAEFISRRKSFLERKHKATGKLADSLQWELQARQEAIHGFLSFESYGRTLDMRYTPSPNFGAGYIQALEDWVKARGWEQKFMDAWKAKRNSPGRVPVNLLNKIAWGIAIKRSQRRARTKNWYRIQKQKAVDGLFELLLLKMPDEVFRAVRREIR